MRTIFGDLLSMLAMNAGIDDPFSPTVKAPREPGPGAARARQRELEKAKRIGPVPEGRWTRQRDRAEMRRLAKGMLHERKMHAAATVKGGAATEYST